MCLSQNMHTHSQTRTRTTHAKNTHSEKLPYSLRESFTCNLKLLVSPLLFFFSQPQNTTKGSEIIKKKKDAIFVKSAKSGKEGGEKRGKTEGLIS